MSRRQRATGAGRLTRRGDGRLSVSSRAGRLRASHSYGPVLWLVIATFLFAIIAPDGRWASSVLVLLLGSAVVASLWTAGVARVDSRATVLLLVAALTAAAINLVVEGSGTAAAVQLFAGLLTLANVTVIGRGVIDQGEVNWDSIRGAVSVYVLLGLVFAFAFGAAAQLGHGPFFAQGTDGTRAIRVYFSYVTLATLGYGDYSPATQAGRALAVVEALMGQLYLVTVVTILISRLRQKSPEQPLD